jgi:hypothetical protein
VPPAVRYGTVTATFPDPPEGLQVRFRPDLRQPVARLTTVSPPLTFAIDEVPATLNSGGELLDPAGTTGVRLLADPDLEPAGWTWRVRISSPTTAPVEFSIAVTAGTTVDLSTVVPIPANLGQAIADWQQAVAAAEAARDEAIDAAASITSGSSAASLQKAANLSDLVSPASARTALGLGSAATHPATDFDPAGAAAAVTLAGLGGLTQAQIDARVAALADSKGAAAAITLTSLGGITPAAVDARFTSLVAAAPTALDTLGELATQLQSDESAAGALATLVGTKAPLASPTFTGTVSGVSKAMVGLPNVDNTPDTAKPVSIAQAAAIANSTINLPVNVMSANGTAVIGARNAVNASAGPVAVTLPAPTAVGQHIIIERSDASTTVANAVTITGTIRGTANTVVTLAAVGAANEGGHYISESLTSWAIAGSIKPRAVLDAAYDAKGAAVTTGGGRALKQPATVNWFEQATSAAQWTAALCTISDDTSTSAFGGQSIRLTTSTPSVSAQITKTTYNLDTTGQDIIVMVKFDSLGDQSGSTVIGTLLGDIQLLVSNNSGFTNYYGLHT